MSQCTICWKKMAKKNLFRHYDTQHSREIHKFACPLCDDRIYANYSNFAVHYKNKHFNEKSKKNSKKKKEKPIPEPIVTTEQHPRYKRAPEKRATLSTETGIVNEPTEDSEAPAETFPIETVFVNCDL